MIQSRLKELCLKAERNTNEKITIQRLVERTGLSYATIQRIMSGKLERVEFATLNALCAYFKCEVGDLLVYVPDDKP